MRARPRLDRKVCIVTGGGGCLGAAIAHSFAEEGAAAVVVADLNAAAAQAVANEIGGSARRVDVTDAAEVDELVAMTVDRFGRLDVMINNAGILCSNARLHNQTAEDWQRSIAVNLLGVVHGITAAVRAMRASGEGGAIVNTGSAAALTAWSHSSPYGATKAAVAHLTKIAALEYAAEGIRVNCVCPGAFDSTMLRDLPEAAIEAARSRHPSGFGTAEDVAGAFVYLASDDARWTTGVVLPVDGGYVVP